MHSYDTVKFVFVGSPCLVDQALIQVSFPILGGFNSLHILFLTITTTQTTSTVYRHPHLYIENIYHC